MATLIIQEKGVARTRPAVNGEEITIAAPCNCTEVTGVQIAGVQYPFYDACGNNVSNITGKFSEGSLIRVLIDTTNTRAQIINQASSSITNETKALFGLGADAVTDDVLTLLSPVVMHWWGKRTPGSTAYVETRTAASWTVQINNKSSTYYWEYSDSVSISQIDGTVSLVNPVSTSVNYGQSQDQAKSFFQKLKGKYCFCDQSAPNIIIYFPDDSDQYLSWSNNTLTVQVGHAFSIASVYSSVPPGEVEFLSSENRNAYPDNEVVDGYEYIYLGIPWENSRAPIRVETGSYVGTGTYGSANPNSLTFGFEPKLVMINCFYNYNGIPCYMIWFSGFTRFGYMNANNTTAFSLGNTLTWHSTDNAGYQANTSGQTYEYIAIG